MLFYAFVPVLGLAFLGVGAVSARGFMMGGWGWSGLGGQIPEDIVARHQAMFQRQAQILGISVDDIKAAWAEGKSLNQIMEEKNISADQVQARVKNAQIQQLKTQLQALVDKGIITQSQADKRLEVMQERFQRVGGFDPKFRRHGFGW